VIIIKSSDPRHLSNSYLVGDEPEGAALLIDSGAPVGPIAQEIERSDLRVTHLLCTHRHPDHVANNRFYADRFGCRILAHSSEAEAIGDVDDTLEDGELLTVGGLHVEVLHVPGHTVGHLAFCVNGTKLFTGDTLFRRSIGGTRGSGHASCGDLQRSVMEKLLRFPPDTVVFPGHTESTTVGEEWTENPFVLAWRGERDTLDRPCTAFGEAAILLVEATDYDGGTKCWVRFDGTGHLDIVPGSRVQVR
jgi:hydroxyacylglutathione hydrolase